MKTNYKFSLACGVLMFALAGSYLGLREKFSELDQNLLQYDRSKAARPFRAELIKLVEPKSFAGGPSLGLEDLHGKTFLLHFWASWCAPCREERPFLEAIAKKYQADELFILGIASYDSKQALLQSGLLPTSPFTVLLDELGQIAVDYRINAIPQSLLIDGAGKIRFHFQGPFNEASLVVLDEEMKKIRSDYPSPEQAHGEPHKML